MIAAKVTEFSNGVMENHIEESSYRKSTTVMGSRSIRITMSMKVNFNII